jgi:hypothetical protein
VTDPDPADLDRWDEPVGLCPRTLEVSVMGSSPQLVPCENDAGHEPPCTATLTWTEVQA